MKMNNEISGRKSFKTLVLLLVFALFSSNLYADYQDGTKRVTGTVISASNNGPLPGATVVVKGTTNGTITDVNGNFAIDASENAILQVTFISFKTTEVSVAGKSTVNIIMEEDMTTIEGVVAVGYGTVKKSDVTGAVASVPTDKLVRGSQANAVDALQGMVAGVNITRSNNRPGSSFSMDIRGLSSIEKSNEPLYVIDGVPGASMDILNPEDIESIDVLKDASATAIYGSRGANGVVIVTTKRGTDGKPVISYKGNVGIKTPTNMPKFMSGDDWVNWAREADRVKTGSAEFRPDAEIFTDPSELKAVQDRNYYDWIDAFANNATQTSHTISAAGGNENAKYSFSGGYYGEEGFIGSEDFDRYNLSATLDLKANDYISFGGSLFLTVSDQNVGNNDIFQDIHRARQVSHPNSLVDGSEQWKFSNGVFNPQVTVDGVVEQNKTTNILANAYIDLKLLKGLKFKSSFSPYITYNRWGRYRDIMSKANQGTTPSYAEMKNTSDFDWVFDNMVTYNLTKGVHKLDFTGVFSMQKFQTEVYEGRANQLSFNSLWYNLDGGVPGYLRSQFTQSTLMSYLGRINYNLLDKYLVTFSGRYDGSSKLAEGHKWAFFPSAAVAWRASEEDFFKNIDVISNLKLRVSYGLIGNDAVDPYGTTTSISDSYYYMFGDNIANGNVPGSLGNKELGWETTSEINLGLDYGLFDNRISGSFDYYNRLTKDLIMNSKIPIHSGYASVPANVGSSRNKGVEIALNTVNVQTKDFSWSTNLTLAYNKNEIVDLAYKEDLGKYSPQLAGMEGDYSNKWFIGESIKSIWKYETVGVWQTDEATEAAKYGQTPGQWRVRDFDNSGDIDPDKDATIIGKGNPDWTGGMTNTFKYKNLDLSVHMYWRTGLTAEDKFMIYYGLEGNAANFKVADVNYWTPDNPTNEWAQPNNMGPYRGNGTHRYIKADFLKISDITLGYTFNKELISRFKASNLRLYATVQNPFTFTKFNGFDPENPSSGIGNDTWMARVVMFGVNVSF